MARNIQVSGNTKAVRRAFDTVSKNIKDFQPVLDAIGDFLKKSTIGRFHKSQTPTGRTWKRSAAAIRERRRTLIRTGKLLRSFEYQAGKKELQIGSDVEYAAALHRGAYIRAAQARRQREKQRTELGLKFSASAPFNPRVIRRKVRRTKPQLSKGAGLKGYRIPRRPILGFSKKDRAFIIRAVRERVEEGWGKGKT